MKPIVLVVDDSRSFAKAIEAGLSDRWTVVTAQTLREARILLARHAVSVLLLDAHLEKEDGLEMLEWIRACGSTLPVAVCTASPSASMMVRATKLGAAFVPKPVSPEALHSFLSAMGRPAIHARVMGAPAIGSEDVTRALQDFAKRFELNETEREIVKAFLEGGDRNVAMDRANIAVSTYQRHTRSIRDKTGTRPSQLAVRILRAALYGPEREADFTVGSPSDFPSFDGEE